MGYWDEYLEQATAYIRGDLSIPPEPPRTKDVWRLLRSVKEIQRIYERSNKRGENCARQMYVQSLKAFED